MASSTAETALRSVAIALADLQLALAMQSMVRFLRKYSPDKPRVPAGVPEGGQWTDGSNSGTLTGAIEKLSPDECEVLYAKDTFHCTMVGLASCHRQAAARYAACLAGHAIPPLSY